MTVIAGMTRRPAPPRPNIPSPGGRSPLRCRDGTTRRRRLCDHRRNDDREHDRARVDQDQLLGVANWTDRIEHAAAPRGQQRGSGYQGRAASRLGHRPSSWGGTGPIGRPGQLPLAPARIFGFAMAPGPRHAQIARFAMPPGMAPGENGAGCRSSNPRPSVYKTAALPTELIRPARAPVLYSTPKVQPSLRAISGVRPSGSKARGSLWRARASRRR